MTTAECIHVFENSRLQSERFTPEAITAAYVAGLAALFEKAVSAPVIKCKKTPRKKCSLVAKEVKKR